MKPPAPTCIAEALMKANYRSAGMGSRSERIENLYTEEGCALVRAQAVWDALLNEGRIETKWHHVRGHPMFPQTDEEYEYQVYTLRLTEPVVPVGRDPQTPHA